MDERTQSHGSGRIGGTAGCPAWSCLLAIVLALLPGTGRDAVARQVVSFEDVPLQQVIRSVEKETGYRFLYRDALVAGRPVTMESGSAELLEEFRDAVRGLGLEVMIDDVRRQVLVYALREAPPPYRYVRGYVLDAETGAPLPYATVTWPSDAGLRGAVADETGRFRLSLPRMGEPVDVTASFLGFEPSVVRIDPADAPGELSMRLHAEPIVASEVVVRSGMLHTDLDTTWHDLMQPGALAPLGESGALRAMQSLPSVSITTALSDGLTVRGSRADGFQVLLDGMPVYGQTHLFGLFDAFNEDAIQTMGFFYGITPATYQAPPGGTVSFLTRSGSRAQHGGSFSVSNTSVRGTTEGPILGGRGSWLLSARRSILSTVDWFGNQDLLAQGLDMYRPRSEPEVGVARPLGGLERTRDPEARYYDVHGKVVLESRSGDQLSVTGYLGGDDAGYDAIRLIRQVNGVEGTQVLRHRADTDHRWGNATASTAYRRAIGSAAVASVVAGYTRYFGAFDKADFVFQGLPNTGGQTPGGPNWRIGEFSNRSTLEQWRLSGRLTWGADVLFSSGGELSVYDNMYRETAPERIDFRARQRSIETDVFLTVSTPSQRRLAVDAGLRAHYYGLGDRIGASPRLDLRLAVTDGMRLALGASRNYQFLHRITLEHVPTLDIWTLSGKDEKPGRVDYATAGLHVELGERMAAQVEAYVKDYTNLRLHELTAREHETTSAEVFTDPWLWDADGLARGLEAMARYDLGPVRTVASYTWSRMELQHPDLNRGRSFPAYWDRTHQGTISLRAALGTRLAATASWSVATGSPNTLAYNDPSEPVRLPSYHRLDLTLQGRFGRMAQVRLGLYNAYDRRNAWYRTPVPVLISRDQPGRLDETANVFVYDLGIQPSVEVTLRF